MFLLLAILAVMALALPQQRVFHSAQEKPIPDITLPASPDLRVIHLIDQFDGVDDLKKTAENLTAESHLVPWHTRHSWSKDAWMVAQMLRKKLDSFGVFETHLQSYQVSGKQYSPNVIAVLRGDGSLSSEAIVVGAHYDDRQRDIMDADVVAPGANDDGSGTTVVLHLASLLAQKRARFNRTVIICFFSGEEQGLFGSKNFVNEPLPEISKYLLRAMIQVDMVGYNEDTKEPHMSFIARYVSPSLTKLLTQVTKLYLPSLDVTDELYACCSDHQSFLAKGIPSVGVVERGGYVVDPQYHKSGDIVNRDGYDVGQMRTIGQAVVAMTATLADII